MIVHLFSLVLLAVLLSACSAPKLILYPNAHFQQIGQADADQDIAECFEIAKDAGAGSSQGKSGQVAGSTAAGAAIGSAAGAVGGATAGLLRGLFRKSPPSEAYKQFVNRCLKERDYDPVGWE